MLSFFFLTTTGWAFSPRVPSATRPLQATTAAEECTPLIDSDKWGVCVSESGKSMFNVVDPAFEVDTINFVVVKNPGLGILLEEVANNGELGVVVVAGVVEGGPAEDSPLKPGDVISKVNGRDVEAKTYDDLVSVLVEATSPVEFVAKRLVKRYKALVEVDGEKYEFFGGENLRRGLIARKLPGNDKTLGPNCGGDAQCFTCAVEVIDGADVLTAPKPPETIVFKDRPTWRLGCQASIREDAASSGPLTIALYPNRKQQ
ncbi:hypothetical protein CTAYLR_003835 [Chrysophaeum taylorii]|uniref:PDZ domain-containing protein n=1 Tax=Chrysophaeum taylorii TaxID=2483200 RepID=A0AAD7UF67_9STRA|nr:hypothetical protein CTAYLR_003835 [Chrysophaeum taylorii]